MPAAVVSRYARAFHTSVVRRSPLSPKRAAPTVSPQPNPAGPSSPGSCPIFLVDEDDAVRDALAMSLRAAGHTVAAFGSGRQFLDAYQPGNSGCLVIDMDLSDVGAVELLRCARRLEDRAPGDHDQPAPEAAHACGRASARAGPVPG